MTTMPLLTEDAARTLLQRLESAFTDAALLAWGRWERLQQVCAEADARELLLPLTSTTRANYVNNHFVEGAIARLEPYLDPNRVRVNNALGFTGVLVREDEDAAFIRFKLLNVDLRPSNVKTSQQKMLDAQEWDEATLAQLEIPGTTPPTVVICGYSLTSDETAIDSVYLLCKQKAQIHWHYRIHGEGGEWTSDLPLPGTPPAESRVTSKRSRRKKDSDRTAEGDGPS